MSDLHELLDVLIRALAGESDQEQWVLAEVVHRAIIIIDDYLCARFKFSRRGKGRFARKPRK